MEVHVKRIGFLYEKLLDPDLISSAISEASKGKRHRPDVKKVIGDVDGHVKKIQAMLRDENYVPSKYQIFDSYDERNEKVRKIQKPKFFPDQIIHWLIVLVCQDVFLKSAYSHSCGSIPKKGTYHGQRMIKRWLKEDRKNTKYVLKMDIRKYYDSINQDKLTGLIKHKIKDAKMLSLIEKVIRTTESGVPIGNYTSQWFANLYLENFDRYVKEQLEALYYIRYIDDMVVFGANKKKLRTMRQKIAVYLKNELGLDLKSNWQVFPIKSRGLDFLGYVYHPGHTKLRARNFLALSRNAAKIRKLRKKREHIPYNLAAGFISRIGQLKHCNSFNLGKKCLTGISIPQLKKVVSNESKRKQSTKSVLV